MTLDQERGPRVLHIATSQNDGGVERYSVQLAAGLAKNGVWVRFACLPGAIVERLCWASGVQTLGLAVRNSGDVRAVRQIAAHIKSQSIDIVHVHSRRDYLPVLLGGVLARRQLLQGQPAPRLVLHAHMLRPLGTPPGLSGRVFARHADRVLAVSQSVQDALNAWHHFAPGLVRRLHNGVDLDRFCAPASPTAQAWRNAVRAEWGLNGNALVVTMIGRLDAKGQAQVLAVLPRLALEVPNLHVVLVGSEGIPGTAERLRTFAHDNAILERVVFAGPREDIPQVLAASDVLAHLPADEAFGLALAEGMAAGLPTIASDIGGCREVVRNGETGALVPPGDLAALRAAMLELLQGEGAADRRLRRGTAGRARAGLEFSLACQTVRLEEIYRKLCPNLGSQSAPASVRPSPS